MTHYDLAIIGTGSGNTILDDRFDDQRVAILERGVFGGTCINVGCIPTKMYVYPADLARNAEHGPDLGVNTGFRGVDWPAVRDRVFGRIDPIAVSGQEYREGLPNVDLFTGDARFVGERELDTGTGETITADQIVIAAGSRPEIPPLPGLDTVEYHTNETVMRLAELPARMAIVGGGYVGSEFAHVFSSFGSHVTQVHRGPRLLGTEDEEVSTRFTELAGRQWDLRLERMVARVEKRGEAIGVILDDGSDLEVDVLLMATGRMPNSDTLALETTGVEVDEDGVIVVDDYQRTTAAGIWALGDISSALQLKHLANQDARVIQHNLLHPDDLHKSDHRYVPHAVFSSPQVASVGLTEAEARRQGLDLVTYVQDYGDVAYGWAMEDTQHFAKLVADRGTGRLVGAHLIGPQASILIQPLIWAMSFEQPVSGLARGQYWIHPALSEVVENALLGVESRLH